MTRQTLHQWGRATALFVAACWMVFLATAAQAQPASAEKPSPAPAAQPAPPSADPAAPKQAAPQLPPGIPATRPATAAQVNPATGESVTRPASMAQPSVTVTPTFKPGEEPKIVFEKTDLDLGTVNEGEKAKFKFPFTNAGKSTLDILEVRKSCGCTRAEASKNAVKPGESADIEGELDTQGRAGKQIKTITVRSNDPTHKEITLKFEVNIKQEVGINPTNVYFRALDLGETGKQEVKITNYTDKPVRVLGLKATTSGAAGKDRIKARIVSPAVEDKPTESQPVVGEKNPILLEITVEPSQELGYFNGTVTIQTDSKAKPNINLSVSGKVSGDIDIFPQSIYFGLVKDTQPTTRSVTLSSRGNIPFKIEKIDPAQLPIEVTSEPLEGKEGYRLKVGLLPEKMAQPSINGKLLIQTNHPKEKTVEIPVTAFVRK